QPLSAPTDHDPTCPRGPIFAPSSSRSIRPDTDRPGLVRRVPLGEPRLGDREVPRPADRRLSRGRPPPDRALTMPLEDHLLTESRNPRSEAIDTLSPAEIVRLMNSEDARVVEAVAAEAYSIARAIEWAADRFRRGGRVVYVGAGTSGRLGVLDAA